MLGRRYQTAVPMKRVRGVMVSVIAISMSLALTACGMAGPKPGTQAVDTPVASTTSGSAKRVRLLSAEQYVNTVNYAFGDDIRIDANFAPFDRRDGLLQVGAASAGVSAPQMEQYQRAAAFVAGRVVDRVHRSYIVRCKPQDERAVDPACATQFLASAGRVLFRRSMTQAELDIAVQDAAASTTELKDFYAGLGTALEGLLMSPQFLYIQDRSEPGLRRAGEQRFDGYTIASRLSFFLWNAGPDLPLLTAAEKGELNTPKGLEKQVDRMLASPRVEIGVRAFFEDMFHFDDLKFIAKDPSVYPAFTGVTASDAREQTLRTVIDHLLVRKLDYRDLFTTRDTFVSPALSTVYNVSVSTWTPYRFPENSARVGLLTQASFLAGHAHPARSSPTLRGKALREIFLCQPVPPPPANVDFSALENPNPNIRTQRERVAQHLENPVCAGCHRITDPAGLALENFDGAGQYRTREKGTLIDASGNLDGKAFQDVVGLGKALHDHPALTTCVAKRAYSYATGGPTTKDDAVTLASINSTFAASGFKLAALLKSIAMDPAFSQMRVVGGEGSASSATTRTSDISQETAHE